MWPTKISNSENTYTILSMLVIGGIAIITMWILYLMIKGRSKSQFISNNDDKENKAIQTVSPFLTRFMQETYSCNDLSSGFTKPPPRPAPYNLFSRYKHINQLSLPTLSNEYYGSLDNALKRKLKLIVDNTFLDRK